MLKLLICLAASLILGALVLQLRQQKLDLNNEVSRLHRQIEDRQSDLWNQQVQIAIYTAPNAIRNTIDSQNLKLVPQMP
jgi:cell division protein FtsL